MWLWFVSWINVVFSFFSKFISYTIVRFLSLFFNCFICSGIFSQENGDVVSTATKVYVGGIPYYSTEDDIRSYFEGCGTITEVDCMTFPESGKFRGIAIISFKVRTKTRFISLFYLPSFFIFPSHTPYSLLLGIMQYPVKSRNSFWISIIELPISVEPLRFISRLFSK